MKIKKPHILSLCDICGINVICGYCGNNCCNGSSGREVKGIDCDCEEALYWKKSSRIQRMIDWIYLKITV